MSTVLFSTVTGRGRRFAARLRQLRQAAGLSQAQLAAASGVPVKTIRGLEITPREPTLNTLLLLAQGLGVGLAAFEMPAVAKEKAPEETVK
jgi:transcriptional regulator with XRE-family HTH domain